MITALNVVLMIGLCVGLWLMWRVIRRLSTLVDTLLNHQEMMKAYGIYAIVCQPRFAYMDKWIAEHKPTNENNVSP